MKKLLITLLVAISFISCKVEKVIVFDEQNFIYNESAMVEINLQKAIGDEVVSQNINATIQNHIASSLILSKVNTDSVSIKEAISHFDEQYNEFKDDFEESSLVWEATFDVEVTYQSSSLISIAINSYLNTGGAHGNTNITFYNFDVVTGKVLATKDVILDMVAFTQIAKDYFEKETQNEEAEYFFGDEFQLPENLGFNSDGIILFYNVYEIASYSSGITEFTIPFDEVSSYISESIIGAI